MALGLHGSLGLESARRSSLTYYLQSLLISATRRGDLQAGLMAEVCDYVASQIERKLRVRLTDLRKVAMELRKLDVIWRSMRPPGAEAGSAASAPIGEGGGSPHKRITISEAVAAATRIDYARALGHVSAITSKYSRVIALVYAIQGMEAAARLAVRIALTDRYLRALSLALGYATITGMLTSKDLEAVVNALRASSAGYMPRFVSATAEARPVEPSERGWKILQRSATTAYIQIQRTMSKVVLNLWTDSVKLPDQLARDMCLIFCAITLYAGSEHAKLDFKDQLERCRELALWLYALAYAMQSLAKVSRPDARRALEALSQERDTVRAELRALLEPLISKVQQMRPASALAGEEEEATGLEAKYSLTGRVDEKTIGIELSDYDISALADKAAKGQPLGQYVIMCSPHRWKKFPHLTFITGTMGAGKTVMTYYLAEKLLEHGYFVVDIGVDVERSEGCWTIMPLDREEHPEAFEVRVWAGLQPKAWNTVILIPRTPDLPRKKKVPPHCRVVAIPLSKLRGKRYAIPLLYPTLDKIPDWLVDATLFALENAEPDWGLADLAKFLLRVAEEGEIEIEVEGETFTVKVPKRQLKACAYRLLMTPNPLICSEDDPCAFTVENIYQPGRFVTTYLGFMRVDLAHAWAQYLFNEVYEFKRRNRDKKVAIILNEAQRVAASRSLVGGTYSRELFASQADVVHRVIVSRGLGLKIIANTQRPRQVAAPLRTQAAVKIILHSDPEDVKDLIQIGDEEYKERILALIQASEFKEEHWGLVVYGTDKYKFIKIIPPGCMLEVEDADPLDYYCKKHPDLCIELGKLVEAGSIENLEGAGQAGGPPLPNIPSVGRKRVLDPAVLEEAILSALILLRPGRVRIKPADIVEAFNLLEVYGNHALGRAEQALHCLAQGADYPPVLRPMGIVGRPVYEVVPEIVEAAAAMYEPAKLSEETLQTLKRLLGA